MKHSSSCLIYYIKIEKPFCVCCHFRTALVKEMFFRQLCCHFFQVLFSHCPPKEIITVTQFMFAGTNIFWALLRPHFNPRPTARAKMSLCRAQNMFMPANINSIVLFYWSKLVRMSPLEELNIVYKQNLLQNLPLRFFKAYMAKLPFLDQIFRPLVNLII